MKRIRTFNLINFLSFIIQAGLFYSMHFQVTGEDLARNISVPYRSLLNPVFGLASKVWGVIYTALAIFCLYHMKMAFTRSEKHPANVDITRVDIFFLISNISAVG